MNKNYTTAKEEGIFSILMYRFLPFWPLFLTFTIISLLVAWAYLKYYATPTYEITASLIIKDEKKGVDDSKLMESMNIFNTKKIVENEIEVIKSKVLIKKVVNDLQLYAPIYEDKYIKSVSAYTTSPIIVEVKSPQSISINSDHWSKIYFSFDPYSSEVRINKTVYPLNTWVRTAYGELRFNLNSNKNSDAQDSLYFSLINPKIITDNLLQRLNVSPASKLSTVVNLTLNDPVPQRGEDILNNLIVAYNQIAINERNALANNTMAFIEERIKFVEYDLNALEKEFQQYKSTKGVVDLSEQGKLYLQNVGDNDRKIEEINLQLAVLEKIENYIISKDDRMGLVPSTLGISDPVLTQLLEKLYNAEIEYEKLIKTIPKNNPIVLSSANEIDKIRPSILENIKTHRVNLQASLSKVSSTKGTNTAVLHSIPLKERELLEISRRKAIKNDLFSYLLQKREESALSYVPSPGDSKIVEFADSSTMPVSPNSLLVYAVAFCIAFGAGIAFIIGSEFLNNKIIFRSEIEEYTDVPVVGELLHVKYIKRKLPESYAAKLNSEQFRDIRAALGLYGNNNHKKTILVTSSIEGEGKSFVSENLAKNLASSGKRVVLINLDLQKPQASSIFNVSTPTGISDYLTGDMQPCEIVVATNYDNLSVVPAGITREKAAATLLEAELKRLFTYLNDSFDYLIVDTPPVGVATDAYLISKYCDCTLYIVRHRHTPKKVLEYLERNIILYKLKNLAIIFNGVQSRGFMKTEYGLSYGYGHKFMYKDRLKYQQKV
jgi:tyrosine-protein kinase Etk/Wzc